jgi:hypothetical protein
VITEREQTVVVVESGQRGHGEPVELRGIGGPDRGAEGDHEVPDEGVGVASPLEELAQREPVVGVLQQGVAVAVEAEDVAQHAQERGAEEVPALSEEAVHRRAPVLETRSLVGDTEAHVAGGAGHVESVQQLGEVRVVAFVEDDEPGVHLVGFVPEVDAVRVGVAAHVVVGLEDRDLVLSVEEVGADQPRDPGSHNGDSHCRSLRSVSTEYGS